MAIEALLTLELRPALSVALVENFVAQVKTSATLPEAEQASLIGSLQWLRKDSIRNAGHRFERAPLGETPYGGELPARFFHECYELRRQLVHGGDIRRAREAAATAAVSWKGQRPTCSRGGSSLGPRCGESGDAHRGAEGPHEA
jgi:hypothetical protein